jgi:CRP-like cAMP-binding protein
MENTSTHPSRKVTVTDQERAHMDVVEFAADEDIFAEGTVGDRAYIVQSGLVEIVKVWKNGESTVGYVGSGEIFGEMSPIDHQPRTAGARALRDTVCIVVPEAMLAWKIDNADPFIRDLLFVLVAGLRQVTEKASKEGR